jgi:hypothetical protein
MGRGIDPVTGTGNGRVPRRALSGEHETPGEIMFVRYFVELPLSFDIAEESLLRAPPQWIPDLAKDAAAHGQALLAEAGKSGGGVALEQIAVTLGPVFRYPLRTILAMTWRPIGVRALCPTLDADIELGALGRDRTQLSISARYRPALGTIGRASSRTVLQRVAEATIKRFLDGVGHAIESRALAWHAST